WGNAWGSPDVAGSARGGRSDAAERDAVQRARRSGIHDAKRRAQRAWLSREGQEHARMRARTRARATTVGRKATRPDASHRAARWVVGRGVYQTFKTWVASLPRVLLTTSYSTRSTSWSVRNPELSMALKWT